MEAAQVPDKPPVSAPQAEEVPAKVSVKRLSTLPIVTGIRHWSSPDYTRVAIDVDAEVKYEAGRVPNPDRIFFDLPNTRLASVLVGKSFDVQDGFLKKIRVAQYQPGYTRVVLEVADVSDYSAFILPNPYRLIIDVHGRQPQSQTLIAKANASESAVRDDEQRRDHRRGEGTIVPLGGESQRGSAVSEHNRLRETCNSRRSNIAAAFSRCGWPCPNFAKERDCR